MINFLASLCCLLLFTTVANSAYTPCEDCTDRANTDLLSKIEIRVYPDNTFDEYTTALVTNVVGLLKKIDSKKPTVLYVSGWTESPASVSVETVLAAYFQRNDHNVLLADYSEIAAGEWDYVAASTEGVGYTLATALDDLVAQGLESTTLHIVGHSLGGQVVGFIGKNTNFTVARITSLDPAGPSFTESDEHLSSSDAAFVDIIHTDAGVLGTDYSSGTVDFYPNGGNSPQPGCEEYPGLEASFNSHYRSWIYYAESLIDEDAFIAVECESDVAFKAGLCSANEKVVMGYATPITASGNFNLQTNSVSPYGRRIEGTIYSA